MNDQDADRLDAKTTNSVVIDLDAVKRNRANQTGITGEVRDPETESDTEIVVLLILAVLIFFGIILR